MVNDPACTVELWTRSRTRVVLACSKEQTFLKSTLALLTYIEFDYAIILAMLKYSINNADDSTNLWCFWPAPNTILACALVRHSET